MKFLALAVLFVACGPLEEPPTSIAVVGGVLTCTGSPPRARARRDGSVAYRCPDGGVYQAGPQGCDIYSDDRALHFRDWAHAAPGSHAYLIPEADYFFALPLAVSTVHMEVRR